MKTFWTILASVFGLSILGGFLFYLLCLNHTEINEIGVAYNALDGKITVQEQPGWYQTSPFVKVAYISTLPIKVRIPSEAKVLVTKVVSFNPKGIDEFIRLQGFSYQMNSGMDNILLGYAFAGSPFPFLNILQESTQEDMKGLRPLSTTNTPAPVVKKDTVKVDTTKNDLYKSVVVSINDNQIQAARDLVSTTNEKNDLYNFIRNNDIQGARNYIKYTNVK